MKVVICAIICLYFAAVEVSLADGGDGVGFRVIQLNVSASSGVVDVGVWYPTADLAKTEVVGPVTMQVAKNAAILPSIKGLIVISHGFSGNFLGHHDTAVYLAQQGYMVAAPTHPDVNGVKSMKPHLDPLVVRPHLITRVLDQVTADPSLQTKFEREDVGIIGFSLGTYTSLRLLGAEVDFGGLEEYCSENPGDAILCSSGAKQRFRPLTPLFTNERDERIGAAVLMGPAYGPLFIRQTLSKIDKPIRIYTAEKDEEVDNRHNAHHVAKSLPRRPAIEVIQRAGHYVFMAPCSDAFAAALPFLCRDAVGVDRKAIHEKLNLEITLFFDENLK